MDKCFPFPFRRRPQAARPRAVRLTVEALEDRQLLSCNVISGYVYYDANTNGLKDANEPGIANTTVELRNEAGQLVTTTTTDAGGFYRFDHDPNVDTSEHLLTQAISFSRSVNGSQTKTIPQFDPGLGQLTGIDIQFDGAITSRIKVENFNAQEPSHLVGTVSGNLTLSGPGVNNLPINPNVLAGTFDASPYDGVPDYAGASGVDFGSKTATGNGALTLTDPAVLSRFTGTGSVSFTLNSLVTSSVDGNGDEDASIRSLVGANVRVVYHYTPSNCLQPGTYVLHEIQPPDYLDGRESQGPTVLPPSNPDDTIVVTLASADSTNNNFGEVLPAYLEACVFLDSNNNGHVDPGEPGLAGFTVTLTGTDDLGHTVLLVQVSNSDGRVYYRNLRPGTYSLVKTSVPGAVDGMVMAGSAGGVAGPNSVTGIGLASGQLAGEYCFAEGTGGGPASLCGFVYVDANDNGVREPGEAPIPGTTVTLDGQADGAGPVHLVTQTAGDGSYCFLNLQPGTYTVTETQPAGYDDGKDSVGSAGGILGNDVIASVRLDAGTAGLNYNFGEKLTAVILPFRGSLNPLDFRPVPNVPVVSKRQLAGDQPFIEMVAADASYVDGLYRRFLGRAADPDGLFYWTSLLAGGRSRTDVVAGIWTSQEHRLRQVEEIYQQLLERDASPAEQGVWAQRLLGGATEDQISAEILASAEYRMRFAPSDADFVNAMYTRVLHRAPDEPGRTSWVNVVATRGRTAVALGFLTSAEALGNFVADRAREYLKRSPLPQETQVWVNQLVSGSETLDTHRVKVLAMDEVFNRALLAVRTNQTT
jgi:hypothetical protein